MSTMSSIRNRYVQLGSTGRYALYPVSLDGDDLCPATFTFDNINLAEEKAEYEANEARMDVSMTLEESIEHEKMMEGE